MIMDPYDDFDFYLPRPVSAAARRAKAAKSLAKIKKNKTDVQPVIIEGNKIAKSWWGKAWCENLERYADYENRIGRGRSYVRQGTVIDLKINAGRVTALVQGSASSPYEVTVNFAPVKPAAWKKIQQASAGKIASLSTLLRGEFPHELSEIFTMKGAGLFPAPGEIRFDCSCPDWASMCKHVAAVLYGIGARLDHDPALFFTLRQIDIQELVSRAVDLQSESMISKAGRKTKRVMNNVDISAVFGIATESPAKPVKKEKGKKAGAKKRRP
jgi:uncharacterized Zn finger protein